MMSGFVYGLTKCLLTNVGLIFCTEGTVITDSRI